MVRNPRAYLDRRNTRGMPVKYRLYFKAHNNSTREYWVESESSAALQFVRACLDAQGWIPLRVEDVVHE